MFADHFLQKYAELYGKEMKRISTSAINMIMAYHWPGNVRQLRNELQRVWALGDGGPLRPEWLTPEDAGAGIAEGVPTDLAGLEQWAIDRALAQADGNKAEAARILGIGRRTLYDKLRARGV